MSYRCATKDTIEAVLVDDHRSSGEEIEPIKLSNNESRADYSPFVDEE